MKLTGFSYFSYASSEITYVITKMLVWIWDEKNIPNM